MKTEYFKSTIHTKNGDEITEFLEVIGGKETRYIKNFLGRTDKVKIQRHQETYFHNRSVITSFEPTQKHHFETAWNA